MRWCVRSPPWFLVLVIKAVLVQHVLERGQVGMLLPIYNGAISRLEGKAMASQVHKVCP